MKRFIFDKWGFILVGENGDDFWNSISRAFNLAIFLAIIFSLGVYDVYVLGLY